MMTNTMTRQVFYFRSGQPRKLMRSQAGDSQLNTKLTASPKLIRTTFKTIAMVSASREEAIKQSPECRFVALNRLYALHTYVFGSRGITEHPRISSCVLLHTPIEILLQYSHEYSVKVFHMCLVWISQPTTHGLLADVVM